MAGIKNVSRVRVEGQERLDLPDFNAIMELMDESIQSQIGAVMGRGGGCLSPFQFTLEDDGVTYWLRPGAFQYYWSKRDKTAPDGTYRSWKGGVGSFDPTAEGQGTLIDYTAAKALGLPAYLYVRPKTVDTATDARRKWAAGAETSVSLKTRTNVVQEWVIRTTTPDALENDGWAPVLYIADWNAVTNAVITMVWDSEDAWSVAEQGGYGGNPTSVQLLAALLNNGTDGTASGINDFDGGATNDRSMGVIQMLTQLRDRLFRHLDKTGAAKWFADPPRDLATIDGAITNLSNDVVALYSSVLGLVNDTGDYSWYVQSSGVLYTPTDWLTGAADLNAFGPPPVFTRTAVGRVNVSYPFPGGAAIQGLSIQPSSRNLVDLCAANVSVRISSTPGQDFYIEMTDVAGTYIDSSFFFRIQWAMP